MDFQIFNTLYYPAQKQKSRLKGDVVAFAAFAYYENSLEIFEICFVQKQKLQLKSVFRTFFANEGLAFLNNFVDLSSDNDQVAKLCMRSVSDSSAHILQPSKLSHYSFISEIYFQNFRESLILAIRISDGDIYFYKGVLCTHKVIARGFIYI